MRVYPRPPPPPRTPPPPLCCNNSLPPPLLAASNASDAAATAALTEQLQQLQQQVGRMLLHEVVLHLTNVTWQVTEQQQLLKEAEAALAGKDAEMQQLQVRCIASAIPEFGSVRGLTQRLQTLLQKAEEGLAHRDGQIAALQVRQSFSNLNPFSVFLLQEQLEAASASGGSHQQQEAQKTANLQQQLGMTISEVARLRQEASASAAVIQVHLNTIQQLQALLAAGGTGQGSASPVSTPRRAVPPPPLRSWRRHMRKSGKCWRRSR